MADGRVATGLGVGGLAWREIPEQSRGFRGAGRWQSQESVAGAAKPRLVQGPERAELECGVGGRGCGVVPRAHWVQVTSVHGQGWRNVDFIPSGGTDAEAPILWPPDMKSLLIGKDPDAGKD